MPVGELPAERWEFAGKLKAVTSQLANHGEALLGGVARRDGAGTTRTARHVRAWQWCRTTTHR